MNSLYGMCERLFEDFPLAAEDAGCGSQAMVLMRHQGTGAAFYVLLRIPGTQDRTAVFALHHSPLRAGERGTVLYASGAVDAGPVQAGAVLPAAYPLPRDRALTGGAGRSMVPQPREAA